MACYEDGPDLDGLPSRDRAQMLSRTVLEGSRIECSVEDDLHHLHRHSPPHPPTLSQASLRVQAQPCPLHSAARRACQERAPFSVLPSYVFRSTSHQIIHLPDLHILRSFMFPDPSDHSLSLSCRKPHARCKFRGSQISRSHIRLTTVAGAAEQVLA